MKNVVRTAVQLAVIAVLSSCAIKNQRVQYDVKDIEPSTYTSLQDKVLLVQEFRDDRRNITGNEPLFIQDHSGSLNDRGACLNAERQYKTPVPGQVRDAIAAHIRQRGAFKAVIVDPAAAHDFVLTGTLQRFYGAQGTSARAAVGAQLGLLGALISMGARTDGDVHVWMSDLKLLDREGNLVKDLGAVTHDMEASFLADAYCWQIYHNVNDQLKVAVDTLADKVEDAGVQYALFKK